MQVWHVTYVFRGGSSTTICKTEEDAIRYAVHSVMDVLHDTVDPFSTSGKEIIADIREALEQKNWHNVLSLWGDAQGSESMTISSVTMQDDVVEPEMGMYCPTCLHVLEADDLDGGRCTFCQSMLT